MKVALVSKGRLFEVEQLHKAILARGDEVLRWDPQLSLDALFSETFWEALATVDVLYYRTGFGNGSGHVLHSFVEERHIHAVNKHILKNTLLSNKTYQGIAAHKAGVRTPPTLIGRWSYEEVEKQLRTPFILKAANGIQGKKVFCISSEHEYVEKLAHLEGEVLIQELIPNQGDFRVFVVGGEVFEMYNRVPPPGDFRANMSQGGYGKPITDESLRAALGEMAVTITRTLQLDIAGIDIIQSAQTGELFFIESNVNPGWKGLDTTLGINTAEHIAEWFFAVHNGSALTAL